MIALKVNRVVAPIGDLQYKPETEYDYMRVRIPSPDGCDVDYEYDTSEPDVDKIIFTRHAGFEHDNAWLNSQGRKVPVDQTVYEVWFDKNKGYQPYVADYMDDGRYYEFELCSDYAEDFDEELDEDLADDTNVKSESDLDQYDSYWSIEKKTINGKTTYGATVKTNEGVVNKTDLTEDQYRDLIKSLHDVNASDALKSMLPSDDKKKAIEQADKKATDKKPKDNTNTETDEYDEFLKKIGVSESGVSGSGSFWSDFDKLIDSVFGDKSDNFKDKSRNYWRY